MTSMAQLMIAGAVAPAAEIQEIPTHPLGQLG
jgi:hypothetical protein